MKDVKVFLADGFEEIEALTPVDILRRAGCDVKCVSVNKTKTVVGAHGIKVEADITAEEAERLALSPEMIILPGGMPGAKNLGRKSHPCGAERRHCQKGGEKRLLPCGYLRGSHDSRKARNFKRQESDLLPRI